METSLVGQLPEPLGYPAAVHIWPRPSLAGEVAPSLTSHIGPAPHAGSTLELDLMVEVGVSWRMERARVWKD